MSETTTSTLQYFVLIASQKKKNKFLTLLSNHGAHAVQTVYGKGSMSPNAIVAAFGFEAIQGRALITCLIKSEDAKELIRILYKDYKFNKPNTGIAFCIPVECLEF